MSGDLFKERCINDKFFVKLGKNGAEIVGMLKKNIYREDEKHMKIATIYKQSKRLHEGREEVGDNARSSTEQF